MGGFGDADAEERLLLADELGEGEGRFFALLKVEFRDVEAHQIDAVVESVFVRRGEIRGVPAFELVVPEEGDLEVQVGAALVEAGTGGAEEAEAVAWSVDVERRILAGQGVSVLGKTLGDVLERYADEESPHKGGERWEKNRVLHFCRDPIARVRLDQLTPEALLTGG